MNENLQFSLEVKSMNLKNEFLMYSHLQILDQGFSTMYERNLHWILKNTCKWLMKISMMILLILWQLTTLIFDIKLKKTLVDLVEHFIWISMKLSQCLFYQYRFNILLYLIIFGILHWTLLYRLSSKELRRYNVY